MQKITKRLKRNEKSIKRTRIDHHFNNRYCMLANDCRLYVKKFENVNSRIVELSEYKIRLKQISENIAEN
jgi:hypothetical protein